MNKLNDKQIEFCEHYLKNGNNANDAYVAAYPKASKKSAQSNASRLMENDGVKEYIKLNQIEARERNKMEIDDLIDVLAKIMYNNDSKDADKIKAISEVAKLSGFYTPIKVEQSGSIENKIIRIKYKKDEDE